MVPPWRWPWFWRHCSCCQWTHVPRTGRAGAAARRWHQPGAEHSHALERRREHRLEGRRAGHGHASPIVWQDRIFLVSCLEEPQERILLCLRSRQRPARCGSRSCCSSPLEDKHQLNSFASSTPATDGQLVYVTFLDRNEMVVAAYDFDGSRSGSCGPARFPASTAIAVARCCSRTR